MIPHQEYRLPRSIHPLSSEPAASSPDFPALRVGRCYGKVGDDAAGSLIASRLQGKIPHTVFDVGVGLENYLSDLLEQKVDVAIKKNLRKRIGRRILREVEPL